MRQPEVFDHTAEASHLIGATYDAWSALIWPETITVVPLDTIDAIATASEPGTLAVRHTMIVARAVSGLIVTRAPWQYPSGTEPLATI